MTSPGDLNLPIVALGVAGADFELVRPVGAGRLADWAARFARAAASPADNRHEG